MARKIKNPVSRTRTLELSGQTLTLEFNFRAYAAMKELCGISLLNGWKDEDMDAKEYACLLFSGLITHQPEIEFDFCLNALNGENFADVVTTIFDAYRASLPKQKETADPKQPIAKS